MHIHLRPSKLMPTPESCDIGASLTPRRLRFADTITALVGSGNDAQSFTVYTSSITSRSTFFAAAASERWISSGTTKGAVDLSDDSPLIFDLYLRCLYADKVDLGDVDQYVFAADGLEPPANGIPDWWDSRDELLSRIIRLYVLADKLGDCASANLVIDHFVKILFGENWIPGTAHFHLAFDKSPETSPLWKLLVDVMVYMCNPKIVAELSEEGMPQAAASRAWAEVLRAVRDSDSDSVSAALSHYFIRDEKGRYHQYDSLHPRPQEAGDVEQKK